MTSTPTATQHGDANLTKGVTERASLYLWTALMLGVCVGAVVLGWHARGGPADPRRLLLGLALLGFTSVYREGFEIVIFLQGLREIYGSSVVLEGVVIGLLFTAAVGVLTFGLHQRLPYKRLLIITGVMLLFVLLVAVGEEVNEMQLAGWIGTTGIQGLSIPGWMGTWFSLFDNWETFIAQFLALAIVVGSYLAAQYVRVWRPRRRGEQAARLAEVAPGAQSDLAPAMTNRPAAA
jgi:high-affinity iron transporter